MTERSCGRCAWFGRYKLDRKGICHEAPPQIYADSNHRACSVMPEVWDDNWCSRFVASEETAGDVK